MEDLTGVVFNDLTAKKYLGYEIGNKRGSLWLWTCVCGKEIEVSASRVKRNRVLSCGCRRARECGTKKICKHCGELSYRLNRHGNFASVCQSCANKQTNGFKYKNPKTLMLVTARTRAKKQGAPFSITEEDFEIPEFCPVLGVKLEPGTRTVHHCSPSLDRVIPELGYVPGNVAVISNRANTIKNTGTPEEHRRIANWIESFVSASVSHSENWT